MPKTCDVPPELREFNKLFEQIARRHDYSYVFDDWLTIMMNFFNSNPKPLSLTRYDRDELDVFNRMLEEYMLLLQREIGERGWYDGLGIFYEALASSSKKSAFGQFFTPPDICSMLAQMTPIEGIGNKVNDPACGSGRNLLAAQVLYPQNFMFGEDLDPKCCKMAALNMMFHGCQGEVININTLSRKEYRQGWRINPMLNTVGVPWIDDLPAHCSYTWSGYDSWGTKKSSPEKDIPMGQLVML